MVKGTRDSKIKKKKTKKKLKKFFFKSWSQKLVNYAKRWVTLDKNSDKM